MRGKLFKKSENLYILKYDYKDGGTTEEIGLLGKLSLKNCQAIERGYDLDELANKEYLDGYDTTNLCRLAFKDGFQKALELMGDKKFSEEQVIMKSTDKIFKSLQQTEWQVEIICNGYVKKVFNGGGIEQKLVPILDVDGCLILKPIK